MLRGMTIYASDGSEIADTPPPVPPQPAVDVLDVETDSPTPEPTPEPPLADTVDAEVVDAVATTEPEPGEWVHDAEWQYDWYDYHGDRLAVRIPSANALQSLYYASRSCSEEFQTQLMDKFVRRHLSEQTIQRVLERMADPDDEDFATGMTGWSDLLQGLSEITNARTEKQLKALTAVKSGKGK